MDIAFLSEKMYNHGNSKIHTLYILITNMGNNMDKQTERIIFGELIKKVREWEKNEGYTDYYENDENSEELEYIQEEYDEPEERLDKIEQFFKSYLLPDPILHTRLIITPKDSQTDFIFYYGKTVELQNNSTEDKYHLFRLIMERYYQKVK